MSKGRDVSVEMKSDDRRRHHRKLCVLLGHLVNRGVCALNRELHQILDVTIALVTEGLVEYFDRGLRRDFTSFCTTYTIGYREDRTFAVVQKCVLVQRAPLVQSAV